jgi:hypothetical protein
MGAIRGVHLLQAECDVPVLGALHVARKVLAARTRLALTSRLRTTLHSATRSEEKRWCGVRDVNATGA